MPWPCSTRTIPIRSSIGSGAIRWPAERIALDGRIDAVLRLFEMRQRQPYLWLPAGFVSPPDLPDRLRARGFVEVGGGARVMLHVGDPRAAAIRPLPPGTSLERLVADRPGASAHDARLAASVVAEAFGLTADRIHALEVEIAADLDNPAADVRLIRVEGCRPPSGGVTGPGA